MLHKDLAKVGLSDLEMLVQNAVAESKSIEYKLLLPGSSDKDKKEFLADVSSFANTLGGDLIYGIQEKNGVATNIEGVSVSDPDEVIRWMDNLMRDGIDPRIQVSVHPINVGIEKIVFVVRVNRSWIGPHRIVFQGHDKFYARNSGGKYSLDTAELRIAFTLSDTGTCQ